MYLKYRSYTHDLNEVKLSIAKDALLNDAGVRYAVRHRWLIDGVLQADTPSQLTTLIEAMQTAYSVDGGDLYLLESNGTTPTAHYLLSSQTDGGVRVTNISFPTSEGAEYTTYRTYAIALEADVLVTSGGLALLSYEESLSFSGGGPIYGFLQTINGLPQKQLLAQATPFRVLQQGTAVGHLARPLANPPLWPQALVHARDLNFGSPTRRGNNSNRTYTGYPVSWSYEFASATPLVGVPRVWL